jgi:hypothetical protein
MRCKCACNLSEMIARILCASPYYSATKPAASYYIPPQNIETQYSTLKHRNTVEPSSIPLEQAKNCNLNDAL